MLNLILVIALIAIAFLVGMWLGMAMSLPATKPRKRRRKSNMNLSLAVGSSVTNPLRQPRELTVLEKEQILEALRQRRKIHALKLYRKWSGASLKQASEAIEKFKKESSELS